MSWLKVLDCTLRDGGYCNEWRFGASNAWQIVRRLAEAQIDIIECGFITNRVNYHPDVTKYATFEQAGAMIPEDREGKCFVCMINYGEYELEGSGNSLPWEANSRPSASCRLKIWISSFRSAHSLGSS